MPAKRVADHAADVVVAGGGVIGLSIAWEAARRGVQATVVDPSPGHGASWAAAGMLAPVTEAVFGDEPLVPVLLAAAERWPAFAAALSDATGRDVGFRPCGTVAVAMDPSDRAVIDQLLAFQHELGLSASRLSASECRALVPALSPAIRGGAEMPGDHQVDNRLLVDALRLACSDAGVRFRTTGVQAVLRDHSGAVSAVRTSEGDVISAPTLVVAIGASPEGLAGLPDGVLPPVRPVKGHVIRLRAAASAPVLERTVRGLVHGRPCYLVPRVDGSIVVGATSEERGFDRTVQAGAVFALLEDARRLLPALDELELVECLAGLRPGSPDNCPWVGPTHIPGLVVATGHYRNGFLLAPITADAIVTYLATGSVPAPLDAFPADRALAAV